jgi:hypothetical protein
MLPQDAFDLSYDGGVEQLRHSSLGQDFDQC